VVATALVMTSLALIRLSSRGVRSYPRREQLL
jgi:hypothetical protein